jgi:hypothetical protein
VTAELPPSFEAAGQPWHENVPSGSGDSVALIALVAFIFGVFLNGYIALSVLNGGGDNNSTLSPNDAPEIVPAATAVATPTATPLPDRTTCSEIAGTEYRSGAEREFYLNNCINQNEPTSTPTQNPDAPPLDGGVPVDTTATPTPEP